MQAIRLNPTLNIHHRHKSCTAQDTILFFMEKGLWVRETVTLLLPGSTRLWEGWGAHRVLEGSCLAENGSHDPSCSKSIGVRDLSSVFIKMKY